MFYLRLFKKKLELMSESLISSFLVSDVSESLILLKSNERCEQIAHFAHQKWVTMSDLLRLLRGNERCERIAHQKWAHEWIVNFFEQIADFTHFWTKTSDLLGNQMSEFPALVISIVSLFLSWKNYLMSSLYLKMGFNVLLKQILCPIRWVAPQKKVLNAQ